MAKQIITLGIGAMDTLTPFITTGLEIGVVATISGRDTGAYIQFRDKRAMVQFRDKRAYIPFRDKRGFIE
jgi:hypothetical protein